MTTRARNLLVLAALAVAAVAGAVVAGAPARRAGALDAVPADAFVVVVIDGAAARASAVAAPVREGALAGAPALARVGEACGWDVLARVRELAAAWPEDAAGALGLAAIVDVSRAEIEGCATKVMGERGGAAKVTRRGRFWLLEDGAKDGAGGAIAFADGGLLVIGAGAWLDAMLDTVEGRRPSAARGGEHAALRSALAAGAGSARPAVATVTAILPEATRARVRREMGLEGAAAGADAAMAGVLAVRAAGAALHVGPAGQGAGARVELRCESEAACTEVKGTLERKRLEWSQDLRLRLLGVGPLVDSLAVEAHGRAVAASAGMAADDLARLLERLDALRGGAARPLPAKGGPAARPPDESLPAAPPGARRQRP